MPSKQKPPLRVRHVNLHADEFLASIAGEMSPAELGVYWMINLLCYSHGGPIESDGRLIRAKFRSSHGNGNIKPIIERLVASGRVYRQGGLIGVRRADVELESAQRRIRDANQWGISGGRPPNVSNGLDHTPPFPPENLRKKEDKEDYINTSELGCSAREARSAPLEPAATSEPDIVAVEIVVANVRSDLDPGARTAAIEQSKRDAWLNNLAAWVGTAEQLDFNDRMLAWQAIEDARIAGCRRATPPHIRTALDRMSKLRLQQRRAA